MFSQSLSTLLILFFPILALHSDFCPSWANHPRSQLDLHDGIHALGTRLAKIILFIYLIVSRIPPGQGDRWRVHHGNVSLPLRKVGYLAGCPSSILENWKPIFLALHARAAWTQDGHRHQSLHHLMEVSRTLADPSFIVFCCIFADLFLAACPHLHIRYRGYWSHRSSSGARGGQCGSLLNSRPSSHGCSDDWHWG